MGYRKGNGVRSDELDTGRGYVRSIDAVEKLNGASRSSTLSEDGPVSCKGRRIQANARQGNGLGVGNRGREAARINQQCSAQVTKGSGRAGERTAWKAAPSNEAHPREISGERTPACLQCACDEAHERGNYDEMRNFNMLTMSCESQVQIDESPHVRQCMAKDC